MVDRDELEASIAQYKNQSAVITAQLQHLEQQKADALKMLDMLSGAIQALEQLLTNMDNRTKVALAALALGEPGTAPTPPLGTDATEAPATA